jgi:5-methyltetrahydropteroyltriglutamate--homocysteine methyltransferase
MLPVSATGIRSMMSRGLIYVEGGNPRHEHEWRVFEEVTLPEDKSIVLGVIDTKSNFIEHPRVVADRIVGFAM